LIHKHGTHKTFVLNNDDVDDDEADCSNCSRQWQWVCLIISLSIAVTVMLAFRFSLLHVRPNSCCLVALNIHSENGSDLIPNP